ncbi:MAG TPA: hypothetical protein VES40_05740 [Ilumatobacteraceae bacterium]|nr:hypothetical protein [Ilumatobacteraceae bacterium]
MSEQRRDLVAEFEAVVPNAPSPPSLRMAISAVTFSMSGVELANTR